MVQPAERAERARDLKAQISELQNESDDEVLFLDISKRRNKVTVYSMLDGSPVPIPEYMLVAAMSKRLPDGRPMFVSESNRNLAPTYVPNTVKCFLHAESEERQSGVLAEIGLASSFCKKATLTNVYSRRIHAEHRHKNEWGAYQEYLTSQQEQENRNQQARQLEATLAIARQAGGVATVEAFACDQCGKEFDANHKLSGHKNLAHKGEGNGQTN